MSPYFDTGVLVKSYVLENDSPFAVGLIQATGGPFWFSHLHAVELPNAIRLKRFRKEITPAQEVAALRALRSDVNSGRLARPHYDLAATFLRAEWLSAKCSAQVGSRSLDILHVAIALEAACTEFVSFDERQRKVAALAGLKVLPAKLIKRKP